jgi:hypothetical protein
MIGTPFSAIRKCAISCTGRNWMLPRTNAIASLSLCSRDSGPGGSDVCACALPCLGGCVSQHRRRSPRIEAGSHRLLNTIHRNAEPVDLPAGAAAARTNR